MLVFLQSSFHQLEDGDRRQCRSKEEEAEQGPGVDRERGGPVNDLLPPQSVFGGWFRRRRKPGSCF